MTRPIYERDQDLRNEREIVSLACDTWKCVARKLPKQYRLDFAMMRDQRICGFVEVKDRPSYSSADLDRMGGYMLSAEKWLAARHLVEISGKPFALIVRLKDGVFWARFNKFDAISLGFGGRTDRNDWQDSEPVAYIPMSQFRKMDAA